MNPPTMNDAIALVGHPYAPIGRGEDVRCTFRALRSAGVTPALLDIYGLNEPEPELREELGPWLDTTGRRINVFHLNGDEIGQALATLDGRLPAAAYNIVYPAWELARYPREWAQQIERFDEVWAPSRFIEAALRTAVSRPVVYMPLASEVMLSGFLGRRWFGIPESEYAFLFFFDVRSWATRKNPDGVVAAFRQLLALRPAAPAVLVLKVNGAELAPQAMDELRHAIADLGERVVLIEGTLGDNAVKNLVRCCDCFVSLHRAEGFGRGLIEAMYLGKPVIGTAYSGNTDFMDRDNSLPVDFRLRPLAEGDYPHWQGQAWADPDIGQAARMMAALVDDPQSGRELGRKAAVAVRRGFSYRAAGVRYLDRLRAIGRETAGAAAGVTQSARPGQAPAAAACGASIRHSA